MNSKKLQYARLSFGYYRHKCGIQSVFLWWRSVACPFSFFWYNFLTSNLKSNSRATAADSQLMMEQISVRDSDFNHDGEETLQLKMQNGSLTKNHTQTELQLRFAGLFSFRFDGKARVTMPPRPSKLSSCSLSGGLSNLWLIVRGKSYLH